MDKNYRSAALDCMKGLLVIQMLLGHCIQFFGHESQPLQGALVNYINVTTFPGFLFAFGYAGWKAYYAKADFARSWRRMLRGALRTLAAFWLSSVGWFAFAEGHIFSTDLLLEILTVRVFAGWSEFIVSFAAVSVVGILLYRPLCRLNAAGLAAAGAVGLIACLTPYALVGSPHLALLVGSERFITFPVVQYFFYYAAGVYCARREVGFCWKLLAAGGVLSAPCFAYALLRGEMPGRFPPSALYLFGGAVFVYLYFLLARRIASWRWLAGVGQSSLFYLLCSNLFLFAFKGSAFRLRGIAFAFPFYLLLLLACWYLASLIRPRANVITASENIKTEIRSGRS